MKQTAVEYLIDQLFPKALSAEQYYHIEQAKEMEKQQIEDTFEIGYVNGADHSWSNDGEKYYNETFKNK